MRLTPKCSILYRFYGARDELLYVGVTDNPGERWTDHMRKKPWWSKVRRQTGEWYDSREVAEDAERKAIETERPRYNVTHAKRSLEPLSATELRLLMYDLDTIVGTDRVRIAELPPRLRHLAPDIPLYQEMTGVRLKLALDALEIRTTNIGNVPRLDPVDLRVVARKAG